MDKVQKRVGPQHCSWPVQGTTAMTSYLLSWRLDSIRPISAMLAAMPSAPRLNMTVASVVPPG